MKRIIAALCLVLLIPFRALADETVASGLTLVIPSQGATNWGTTFKNSFATPISSHDHTGGGKGLQLGSNAFADSSINDQKFRLRNNQYLRGRNQLDNADVNILKVNTSDQIEFASVPINASPPGVIVAYGGSSAPTGWLLCDGSAVSRTTYANLFAVVGTTYGVGDGATTFNLPDLRQRFPLGKAASGTGSTLGGSGGSIDLTLSVPAHYHGMGTGADLNITSGGAHTHSIDHDHASVTSGAGTNHTHSIDHDHASVTSGSSAPSTDAQGTHTHFTVTDSLDGLTLSSSTYIERSYGGGGGVFAYDLKGTNTPPGIGLTTANGSHSHTVAAHTHAVDLPNFTGTSGGESSHTHAVDLPNFTGTSGSTSHTHASGTIAGSIGLVTGGVNGNAAMTTGSGNPPYLVVNYIIKQ